VVKLIHLTPVRKISYDKTKSRTAFLNPLLALILRYDGATRKKKGWTVQKLFSPLWVEDATTLELLWKSNSWTSEDLWGLEKLILLD